MGSNSSKGNNEVPVPTTKKESESCDNPDPRSPTPEITRTPLQNKPGAKHNITKNVDLRKTFESAKNEEKLIHNNPILSAVIKNHLQSYDPRSPTQDFDRTPIIIASKIDELSNDKNLLRLQTENNCASPVLKHDNDDSCDSCAEAGELSPDIVVPKNLCDGFYDMTLNDTIKETEEPLGSSTASNEAIENNISNGFIERKATRLLETNFDYIETENKDIEDGKGSVEDSNCANTAEEELKNLPVFKILENDPRSPSNGIERTPIVISKTDTSEDNVEDMSDDSLIKVLQNTNNELRQNINSDKSADGLLIYEDEATTLNDTPKKSKSTTNGGSRTPLSCMKNKTDAGHTRSKSVNTLYDSNNQKVANSKIPRRVSHIPRLKSLTKQPKLIPTVSSVSLKNLTKTSIAGDCENTPPHSHRDRWDKDSSIVL